MGNMFKADGGWFDNPEPPPSTWKAMFERSLSSVVKLQHRQGLPEKANMLTLGDQTVGEETKEDWAHEKKTEQQDKKEPTPSLLPQAVNVTCQFSIIPGDTIIINTMQFNLAGSLALLSAQLSRVTKYICKRPESTFVPSIT